MNEHADVTYRVRESFSGLCMDVPVENVLARSRAHRRRRRAGVTAAAAGTAGAVAAMTLTLGGAAQVHSGAQPRPSAGSAALTAFSVTSGPGESTTLILHKGPQYAPLDPGALRQVLAQHGIPALVTVGTFCRSTTGSLGSVGQLLHPSTLADGSDEMVINGAAMPSGTELSIGYFPSYIRLAVVGRAAALLCSSAPGQPAAHIAPTGTPIRGE
jgi:hypothetical protein